MSEPDATDFSNSRLAEFITDRAAVLIVAELPDGISLAKFANQGFYSTARNLPTYNEYSNSNSLATMKADQKAKLKAKRNIVASETDRKDVFHVFSWTLTQQPGDVLNFDKAIMYVFLPLHAWLLSLPRSWRSRSRP